MDCTGWACFLISESLWIVMGKNDGNFLQSCRWIELQFDTSINRSSRVSGSECLDLDLSKVRYYQ